MRGDSDPADREAIVSCSCCVPGGCCSPLLVAHLTRKGLHPRHPHKHPPHTPACACCSYVADAMITSVRPVPLFARKKKQQAMRNGSFFAWQDDVISGSWAGHEPSMYSFKKFDGERSLPVPSAAMLDSTPPFVGELMI
mmetsp:Transcript_27715/g.60683  ORF Transcript_27715/g.60683 Transcript_27715/m.60683 type:complete len:139 (+) Transcript_27715:2439-2855(+)